MSTVIHKQSTRVTLRKQQLLVLMILALLTVLAVTYIMLYAVAHVDLGHMVQLWTPDIMYGH